MSSVTKDETISNAFPIALSCLPAEGQAMSSDAGFPYVVKADVGRLSDGSVGLRLTLAASEEAYQSQAWTHVAYMLEPATARELATDLAWR